MSDEKKTKHTPGPWYAPQPVGSSQQWVVWSKKDGTAVADVDGPIASTRAANTTLIAAAPELTEAGSDAYRAMNLVVALCDAYLPIDPKALEQLHRAVTKLGDALAKARGE